MRRWQLPIDAWRDVAKEVRAGRPSWQNMLYEVFALHIMPSGLLAAGEIELLREWFEVSMEGIALTDAPTCAALTAHFRRACGAAEVHKGAVLSGRLDF